MAFVKIITRVVTIIIKYNNEHTQSYNLIIYYRDISYVGIEVWLIYNLILNCQNHSLNTYYTKKRRLNENVSVNNTSQKKKFVGK